MRVFWVLTLVIAQLSGVAKAQQHSASASPADHPQERIDPVSRQAHVELLAKAKSGRIDLYFLGDSITRRWGATDYPEFLAHWRQSFHGWNAANFGWGADETQHILWRIENGELDGIEPKVVVLLAGTNNIGTALAAGRTVDAAELARGIAAIVQAIRVRAPRATLVLLAIFPRNDLPAANAAIDAVNHRLAELADGRQVRLLDINDRLTDTFGHLAANVSHDGLHLNLQGYQAWAEALRPLLTELLGPPANEDFAPPATGVPATNPTMTKRKTR